MNPTDFYIKHFTDLCCYEDYLMRIDLMGRKHNDREVLNSLFKCDGHMYIVAGGEVVWINHNGEKVDNPNITSISNHAFAYCDVLRKAVIPDGVRSIGTYAFECCRKTESVIIPKSVTHIGPYAFYDCRKLESVLILSSVTSIGDWAFADCSGLTSVTIPTSVTSIGEGAFWMCNNLKSVKVPKGCKIGRYAFPNECEVIRY